jgi:outer membrane protein OmpU
MKISTALCTILLLPTAALAHEAHHQAANINASTGIGIGGFMKQQLGVVHQDIRYQHGRTMPLTSLVNDTEIHVVARHTMENGTRYGAVVELEADVTEANHDEGFNADKTYLFLENTLGRIELGSNNDAATNLSVDAATLARATGGIHGDWELYANMPHQHGGTSYGVTNPSGHAHEFIDSPSLPLAAAHAESADSSKITYYTPRMSGWQLGVSFAPDSGNAGTAAAITGDVKGQFSNVVDTGVNYQKKYGVVTVASSLAGEFASSESPVLEDIRAYSAGLTVSAYGFSVGGSYGDWGNSTLLTTDSEESHYWTIGAAYVQGPAAVSVTYLDSELSGNSTNVLSVGTDYALAPGLTPYAEVNFFVLDHASAAERDNEGSAILTGMRLSF